jgi:cyanophycin synthetase
MTEPRVQFVDARRLMGPNYLGPKPLVLTEFALAAGVDAESVATEFIEALRVHASPLNVAAPRAVRTRTHNGGVVFAFEAPLDLLLPYADLAEIAAFAVCGLALPEDWTAVLERAFRVAQSSALVLLEREAQARGAAFLWDDEFVTLGLGTRSETYPVSALPDVARVAWQQLGRIPVALVTGTNGKTTTTRLLAHLSRMQYTRVGVCSTDGVAIGQEQAEQGDWTGPSAARRVLCDKTVDCAVLETARGGILRRGLAFRDYDVGVVTQVARDHLGSYGIDDLDAMAQVKGTVLEYVRPDGDAVLNACDPKLRALGPTLGARLACFADLDACVGDQRELVLAYLAAHQNAGGRAALARDGELVFTGATEEKLIKVDIIPITFGGAARYNVENALAAALAADALGVPRAAIRAGLLSFTAGDNPGRGELYQVSGKWLLVDFGHNAEGVSAVLALARTLATRAGGLLHAVVAGSPGDRATEDIHALGLAIEAAKPERVIVRELTDYLRGRQSGEVPAIIRGALLRTPMSLAPSEVAAIEDALSSAGPNDVVVLLAHVERQAVQAWQKSVGAKRADDVV